ncbi:MAG: hypothetical protein IPP41_07655 [Rhodocyclaceae bacterium]|nr:hypothetical protein [Rhodocyclaceae bacterium]
MSILRPLNTFRLLKITLIVLRYGLDRMILEQEVDFGFWASYCAALYR